MSCRLCCLPRQNGRAFDIHRSCSGIVLFERVPRFDRGIAGDPTLHPTRQNREAVLVCVRKSVPLGLESSPQPKPICLVL